MPCANLYLCKKIGHDQDKIIMRVLACVIKCVLFIISLLLIFLIVYLFIANEVK